MLIALAGTDIGDSIHISHVTLPEGSVSAITDRDFTIATVVAPSAMKRTDEEEAEEAAAAGAAPAEAGGEEAEASEGEAEVTGE